MTQLELKVTSQEHTAQVAQALAAQLHPGDVLLLDGALAAGKTFFTRALVEALGSDETVTSPTYTIANIYETSRAPVLHVDAYRLKDAREFYALGLDDYFDTGICVIEWGVRIGDFFDDPLSIHIGFGPEAADEASRVLTLSAQAPRWTPLLDHMKAFADV